MSSKVLPEGDLRQFSPPVWRRLAGLKPATRPEGHSTEAEPGGAGRPPAHVSDLEGELPRFLEQAREEGRSEVAQAAAQRAEQEIAAARLRIAGAVEEILRARLSMRRQMEEDLVHLAVAVARRILRRELSVDPDALAGIVHAAIDKLDVREVHRLRVAPVDAPAIGRWLAGAALPGRVTVEADAALERGAAVFETARGTIDASVETQLQEIDRGFADLVRRQS